MQGDMTTPVSAEAIGPYVISQLKSGGVLPIEAFRETAVGRDGSGLADGSADATKRADRAAFGTHIREAVDVLRGRR